jgi:hypothetical protein
MQSCSLVTAAAQASGLGRYLDLHSVAATSVRPLVDGNRALLGVGKDVEPEAAPLQRRRLRSNGDGT